MVIAWQFTWLAIFTVALSRIVDSYLIVMDELPFSTLIGAMLRTHVRVWPDSPNRISCCAIYSTFHRRASWEFAVTVCTPTRQLSFTTTHALNAACTLLNVRNRRALPTYCSSLAWNCPRFVPFVSSHCYGCAFLLLRLREHLLDRHQHEPWTTSSNATAISVRAEGASKADPSGSCERHQPSATARLLRSHNTTLPQGPATQDHLALAASGRQIENP